MTADPKTSMPNVDETYDASQDAHDCYFVAIEANRSRGDRHWPQPLSAAGEDNGTDQNP
jgi:hypothetical protein